MVLPWSAGKCEILEGLELHAKAGATPGAPAASWQKLAPTDLVLVSFKWPCN